MTSVPADAETRSLILEGKLSFEGPEWEQVSQDAKDCIRGLLERYSHRRKTIGKALKSDWLSGRNAYQTVELPAVPINMRKVRC